MFDEIADDVHKYAAEQGLVKTPARSQIEEKAKEFGDKGVQLYAKA